MAGTELYPDQIVDYVVKELSYEGVTGAPLERLWQLVSQKVKVDDLYKKIIYSWLCQNDEIEIVQDNGENALNPKPKNHNDVEENGFTIRINIDYLWVSLTGAPKENNSIGGMAFDLLVEIAKSRNEGIDSLSLTRVTGQDSRSLTQRIKAISHLTKKLPIIKNGRTLSLLILNEFYNPNQNKTVHVNEKNDDITVITTDIRIRIVNSVKNAKHSIRQISDLRREMELDKTHRLKVIYRSAVNYLVEKECLVKVLVVSPAAPNKKFLSLKYVKDYVLTGDNTEDDEAMEEDDEQGELDDDFINDELKDMEGEELPTSLSNVEDFQIKSLEDDQELPALNRFFPLQNQVFELVDKMGTAGLSSNDILEAVFGKSYWRLFSKMIGSYTTGNLLPHISNYGIIRHYDFKGRTKFYRYLTRSNLLKLSNQPLEPRGSILPVFKPHETSLQQLNKKQHTPIVGGIKLFDDNRDTKISGRCRSTINTNMVKKEKKSVEIKRKRGSPKQSEEAPVSATPKRLKKKLKAGKEVNKDELGEDKAMEAIQNKSTQPPEVVDLDPQIVQKFVTSDGKSDVETSNKSDAKTEDKAALKEREKPVLTISEIEGPSFRAIERRTTILKILEKNDGVHVKDHTFIEALRSELDSTVDRRAFQGDLKSLAAQKKIHIVGEFVGRDIQETPYVIGPTATNASINAFKAKLKDKKSYSLKKPEQVQNVEIEFYDDEFEKSFNEIREHKKRKRSTRAGNNEMVEELQREAYVAGIANVQYQQYQQQSQQSYDKYQGSVQQPEAIKTEPKKATKPPIAKAAKKSKKVATTKKPPSKIKQEHQEEGDWDSSIRKARKPHTTRKKRNASHLNSSETMLLFKAVIICKTIKENQINWEKITSLFENVPEEVLRKKWPRIRMMMGPEGGKSARRTWKRILLASVRDGKITLPEVEELDLETLVQLWQDAEIMGSINDQEVNEFLFANYEENFKHYNFVKSNASSNSFAYDSNSMVQREQFLIDKSFTYNVEDKLDGSLVNVSNERSTNEVIKHVIIAILASGNSANITKLPLLDSFDQNDIEQVFLGMTRRKEVLVGADSKLFLGETLTHILDDSSYDFQLPKVNNFQQVLKNLFDANKGFILNPIFDNSFMVSIVELINQNSMDLIRIDHYRKEVLNGYEARTIEREKLDCDLILSKGSQPIKDLVKTSPLVPIDKPCSKIWIDVEGKINKPIWNKINRIVLTSILSQPGMTEMDLYRKLSPLLSLDELSNVLKWLQDAQSIERKDFNGLWLLPQWYTVFGV